MVDLPRQVQAQAEALEAYDQSVQQAQAQADPAPAETAPAQEPTPAPPDPPPAPSEDWRQKYLSLQGMFNTTASQLRDATGREQALKTQVDQLSTQVEKIAAQPKPHDPAVTAKDVETFGSDLLDAMKRSALDVVAQVRSEFAGELQTLKSQFAGLEKQLRGTTEVVGQTTRQSYFRELAQLVPDYEVVNADQRFLSWLTQVDPVAGVPRQAFLNTAFEQMDAERTARLFNLWKSEIGAPPAAPAQTSAPATTPAPRPSPSPSTARSEAPASPGTPNKVWSSAEIDAVYRAAGRGEFRGKEADFAKISAEIDLALEQGRVRA